MELQSWLERINLPVVFGFTLAFVFLAITAGMRLGILTKARTGGGESVGPVVGATLGLLAFILAFTFNMTANRFDLRKQLFLEEINVIDTAYLRAGLLPQPYAEDVRSLLRDYVDLHVRYLREPEILTEALAESETILGRLWSSVEKLAAGHQPTMYQSLFIQSLNQVIDSHGKRVIVGLQYRIPGTIWFGLYAVAALAMLTVGYQFGQSSQRHVIVSVILAMTFSVVIMLIADLDRASEGTVQLDMQALYDLQQKLHAAPVH
jgi:hypothetical protein